MIRKFKKITGQETQHYVHEKQNRYKYIDIFLKSLETVLTEPDCRKKFEEELLLIVENILEETNKNDEIYCQGVINKWRVAIRNFLGEKEKKQKKELTTCVTCNQNHWAITKKPERWQIICTNCGLEWGIRRRNQF